MKKKIVKLFCLLLLLSVFVSVQPVAATTIWEPTASGQIDVHFLSFPHDTFAIFDDDDTGFVNDSLMLSSFDRIYFSQIGNDWKLEGTFGELILTDSDNFVLAWYNNDNWLGNSGYTALGSGGGLYMIEWFDGAGSGTVAIGSDIQPIPVPASALLLVSGLIGLIGLRSRFRK